jgi:hypothetical protein
MKKSTRIQEKRRKIEKIVKQTESERQKEKRKESEENYEIKKKEITKNER